jgi:predicted enzyme related to lactoylglutathione lyase
MMAHTINWLEFQSKDLGKTQDFFGKVFGWTFQPMDDGYIMFNTGGPEGSVGGGFGTENVSQAALAYISVESIEDALAKIEAAGGQALMPKVPLPEGWGFISQFKDPHGCIWGLWAQG